MVLKVSSNFRALAMAGVATVAMVGAPAWAQEAPQAFNIPSQDLAGALEAFGRQSGQDLVFDARQARGKRAPAVIGTYRSDEALARLLDGSALKARRVNASSVLVEAAGPQDVAVAAAEPAVVEEVLVTGTRIRGAPPASPVTVVTAEQFQDAGQLDLGEVVRSLPQNFNGGRNPGAGTGRGSTNANYGGTSTLNLRGVGNDASLTLLNGHRLATNAVGGVDLGTIPIAAVDRLEVLTDGASALYGSDAVGGVANIITKRDYTGITASALYGESTAGGYHQQQYGLTGGDIWRGGGVIASAGFWRNSAILANQRSYTRLQNPENTLYPDLQRTNLFVSAHQDLTDSARFSIDALYSNLINGTLFAYGAAPLTSSGAVSKIGTRSYVVSPSLEVSLPGGWAMETYLSYGLDRSRARTESYSAGRLSSVLVQCYCNTSRSAEANLEGGLWRVPAGQVRLAIGGGYRDNRNKATALFNGAPRGQQYTVKDAVRYGFAELNLPVISPLQDVSLVHALRLSAALRYEDYKDVQSVATPKFGVVYEITPSIALKASWGKSFKIPVFNQRYQTQSAVLSKVTGYGALYPADALFISLGGGSVDLKPEKATSSTVTASYQPAWLPRLKLEASYYHIDFKDRVVYPVSSTAGVLTNPLYATFVTKSPSQMAQAAAISTALVGLANSTGVPYDPSKVVAIINQRATNASSQAIEGFDLSASYRLTMANGDNLVLAASSTYLDITQQLLPSAPSLGVTGNFYQPRHMQARASTTWDHGPLTLSMFANYVGAARFRGLTPILDIDPETTIDAVVRWTAPHPVDATFALQVTNLFNGKPTVVRGGQPYESSFDAASYAVTGRVVSLQVLKAF
jgi:iron complex outermembrane receptor protein